MIRTKAEKQEMVTALAARLRNASTVYVTDFTGLDVAKITQLRRRLRLAGGGTDFVVVKNTLARRALADAQVQGLEAHLAGPTGLVLTGADPIAAAKVLADFAKEFEKPAIKAAGGWQDRDAGAGEAARQSAHETRAARPARWGAPGADGGLRRRVERLTDEHGGCPRGAADQARRGRGGRFLTQ